MIADNAMHRVLYVELSSKEQEQFLINLQQRRLATVAKYREQQAAKKVANDARINARIERISTQLEKKIERYNSLHEDIEHAIAQLSALHTMVEAGI